VTDDGGDTEAADVVTGVVAGAESDPPSSPHAAVNIRPPNTSADTNVPVDIPSP
jgi:hypothetical protein